MPDQLDLPESEVPTDVVVALHQLYARQSHRIDDGDAAGWAATFTPDGTFTSPSYPAPVQGRAALTAFAQAFADGCRRDDEVRRHLVTDLVADPDGTPDAVRVRAYLQIVSTARGEASRLLRLTTLSDRLVRTGGSWQVQERTVRRDDAGQTHPTARGERT